MSYKFTLFLSFFLILPIFLCAEKPIWTNKLPFSEDAFWGVGSGQTQIEAETYAKREILMQLNSHVQAIVSIEDYSGGGEYQLKEDLNTYFSSNSLRGAELEEQYEDDGKIWVLMKYCDDCGEMIIESALNRFKDKYDLNPVTLMEEINNSKINEVLKIERRLKELDLDDYRSEDILVSLSGKTMILKIINFLPYETNLSNSQEKGLSELSTTLFQELKELNYQSLSIIGHANPTGVEDEEDDLIDLSRNRAQTMSDFLKKSGFIIDNIIWEGGTKAIGNTSTKEGMGMNRRVEIVIDFE